jgi:uncharacterized protein (DUF1697 family)
VTTYVALLRAVNVGGRAVPMADLRAMLAGAGFDDVRTLLQSGNAVFRSTARSATRIEETLAAEAAHALGLQTEFFVRSAAEWQAVVDAKPFLAEAKNDPARLVVVALKAEPAETTVAALRAAIVGRETVAAGAKHAYVYYPDGQGESKLTLKVIERRLGVSGTARNWNTVLKLAALLT